MRQMRRTLQSFSLVLLALVTGASVATACDVTILRKVPPRKGAGSGSEFKADAKYWRSLSDLEKVDLAYGVTVGLYVDQARTLARATSGPGTATYPAAAAGRKMVDPFRPDAELPDTGPGGQFGTGPGDLYENRTSEARYLAAMAAHPRPAFSGTNHWDATMAPLKAAAERESEILRERARVGVQQATAGEASVATARPKPFDPFEYETLEREIDEFYSNSENADVSLERAVQTIVFQHSGIPLK